MFIKIRHKLSKLKSFPYESYTYIDKSKTHTYKIIYNNYYNVTKKRGEAYIA